MGDIQRGHENREKDGFARICEAISSTTWSNAIIHSKDNKIEVSDKINNDFQSEIHCVEESSRDLTGSVKLSNSFDILLKDKLNKDYEEAFSTRDMDVNDLEQVIVEAKM